MVDEHDDDVTVPTRRVVGADPLIVSPTLATGNTGQIIRPADQSPWWFIPGLCAVALILGGLLVVAADHRRETAAVEAASVGSDASVPESQPEPGAEPAPPGEITNDTVSVDAAVPDSTIDPRLGELPPAGTVRYGGSDRPILTRCEVHLPFDPVDTEFQTSSYFFFDSSGVSQMIDRISTPDGERAALERGDFRFVDLEAIGDDGAFVATFDSDRRVEVTVHPPTSADGDNDGDCGDRVVTNAPGQFAEPHTRIVLDVCTDLVNDTGTTISGLTSQGARFEILQAGGELAEIVFAPGDGRVMRTAAPAFVIRTDGILSASGVVSNGSDDLDITIDIGSTVGERSARGCAPSDRL